MGNDSMAGDEMLKLALTQAPLGSGPIEEQSTLGTLVLQVNGRCLTEGIANDSKELLPGPLVSGYHIAEWLVWNVWRLLWESRSDGPGHEWAFAHCLSSIGAGFVWPNVEISSDGVYTQVKYAPTADAAPSLYRYVGVAALEVVLAKDIEAAIRGFVQTVLDRLGAAGVVDTNLHRIWQDLEATRQDPSAVRLHRLGARLGCDPDEIDDASLRAIMSAADDLGRDAVDELVADAGARGSMVVPRSKELIAVAKGSGSAANPADGATLSDNARPAFGETQAWRMGIRAADALRQQQALDGQPIDNEALTALAGTRTRALRDGHAQPNVPSFMLATSSRSWVALRSKWETGRRFDLARLLGDRLLGQVEPLLPATRAYTYRQKAQRAFAQGLLCPYRALDDYLDGDGSEERREEAANHFGVSPWTVDAVLVNNDPERYPMVVAGMRPW